MTMRYYSSSSITQQQLILFIPFIILIIDILSSNSSSSTTTTKVVVWGFDHNKKHVNSTSTSSNNKSYYYKKKKNAGAELSLAVFIPLTYQGEIIEEPGLAQMSAALLAIDHFNERNDSVITDLSKLTANCNITFDRRSSNVFDTGTSGHMGSESLMEHILNNGGHPPHAIAGPYNDIPARELSVLATSMHIPIVASRGNNNFDLSDPKFHPYLSHMFPGIISNSLVVLSYLTERMHRTNYIAILYTFSTVMSQRMEILQLFANQEYNMKTATFGFTVFAAETEGDNGEAIDRTPEHTIQLLKQSGYTTIIVMLEDPNSEAGVLADAADKYGLLNGDYIWFINGGLFDSAFNGSSFLERSKSDDNPSLFKLMKGAAYIEPFVYNEHFEQIWNNQNISFIKRLNQWNPLKPNHFHPYDYFQFMKHYDTLTGHYFVYDAIMTIGIGACNAKTGRATSTNTNMNTSTKGYATTTPPTGEHLLQGIRSINFTGITGRIAFNDPIHPGVRQYLTTDYLVYNFFPQGLDGPEIIGTDIFSTRNMSWNSLYTFVYADGSTSPPVQYQPNQNYLSNTLRTIVFILMAIALLFVTLSMIWTYCYRNHTIIRAAQPIFLFLVGLGSICVTMVLYLLSWDEGQQGWDTESLTTACIVADWLLCCGAVITYTSLFTKMWRVNKVLQFSRRQIKTIHVIWPFITLNVAAIVFLSVATAKADYGWKRIEIDSISGASIGRCSGQGMWLFLLSIGVVTILPIILTGIMAWKTKDVDDIYSESSWIFTLILLQLQMIVVGLPLIVMLEKVSAEGKYMAFSLLVWTFPMTTIGLIIVPKMIMVHRPDLRHSGKKRGTHGGGVIVTGISTANITSGETYNNGLTIKQQQQQQEQQQQHPQETELVIEQLAEL